MPAIGCACAQELSARGMDAEYTVEKRADYAQVTIRASKLAATFAPRLKAEIVILTGSGTKCIVLDLSACAACHVSVVNAMAMGDRLCKNAGGKLILTGLTPQIEKMLTSAKIDTKFTIAYNQAQVDAMINRTERR